MTDERALRTSIDACVRDFPGATRERVEQLVLAFYERTSGAKVHRYRVLLAERDARAHLRADERTRNEGSAQRVSPPPHVQTNLADLDEHRIQGRSTLMRQDLTVLERSADERPPTTSPRPARPR